MKSDQLIIEREPLLTIAVGRRGIGKTHKTKQLIKQYVKGNPAKGVKPRKVLVYDINMEYTDIKGLRIEDVKKFTYHPKVEARRIYPFREDGTIMSSNEMITALEVILSDFRGGLLIVEDVKRYVSDNVSRDVYGFLVTTRHRDCDLLLQVQGVNVIKNPKLFPNINLLRIYKYSGNVDDYKRSWGEHYGCLKLCETIINNRYSKASIAISEGKIKDSIGQKKALSFHVYYNMDNYKISGEFSKEEFQEAVKEFVFDNEDITIGKYLRKKDVSSGKMVHNYKTAFSEVEREMFLNHYGNK